MRLLDSSGGEPPSVDGRLDEHERRIGLMESAVAGIASAVGRIDQEVEADRERRRKTHVEAADADAAIIRIEHKIDGLAEKANERHLRYRGRFDRIEERLEVVRDKAEDSGRYMQVTLTDEVKRHRTFREKLVMAAIGLLCSSALIVLGALIKSCVSR